MENDYSSLSIAEFYPIYLNAHKRSLTKLAHFFGQFLTLGYIFFVFWLCIHFSWIALGYLWFTTEVIYIPAWWSHKKIEGNVPLGKTAKWSSKYCDLKMFADVVFLRKIPLDTTNRTYRYEAGELKWS